MDKALRYLAYVAAAIGAVFASVPDAVKWLVLIMALDVATGVAIAARDGKLSSTEAWKGGMKKAATLVVIGLVMVLDKGLKLIPGVDIASAVTVYYIWTEALSVITNAAALGVPIPDILLNMLAKASPDKLPLPFPVVVAPPSGDPVPFDVPNPTADVPPIVDPSAQAVIPAAEVVQDPRLMRGA